MDRLNRLLDSLPRDRIVIGGSDSPAFRALGVAGFHVGLVVLVLGAVGRGYPLWLGVGVALVAAVSFFAWGVVRTWLTGRETLVLLEHVWIAGSAVVGLVWWAGGPILGWLDVFGAGLCVFLGFGRLGCTVAGCCHGHPSAVGITYHRLGDDPHRLAGVRLFPVQLLEAAALFSLGGLGLALVPLTGEGTVTVVLLAVYGVVRFGTEALRGDPRPVLLGVPVARAAAGAQLGVAMAIDHLRHERAVPVGPAAVLASVLALVLVAALVWWHRRPRAGSALVAELRRSLTDHAGRSEVTTWNLGEEITVAVSGGSSERHVSLASTTLSSATLVAVLRAAVGPGAAVLESSTGVVHALLADGVDSAVLTDGVDRRSRPTSERPAYFRHSNG